MMKRLKDVWTQGRLDRLEKLERLEVVLRPQLDAAEKRHEAKRAEQREQVLKEWPKKIAELDSRLGQLAGEQAVAQTGFEEARQAMRVAEERVNALFRESAGLSARRDRARVAFDVELRPLGNERLEDVLGKLCLMRDNANTLTTLVPNFGRHWFTKEKTFLALETSTPGMQAVAKECERAIAELEALRYSPMPPAEIEAAADAALARCLDAGGGVYQSAIGKPYDVLAA